MTATATPPADSSETPAPRRGHTARWVALGVGLVLVALVALLATRKSVQDEPISSRILGKPVPVVAGPTLDGGAVNIDDLRGRWVVVNFFSTWCTPCRQEHPELVRFSDEHQAAGDGVEVVSVAFDDNTQALQSFFQTNGGNWPVVVGDGTGAIALSFGVTGVPESYIVSPDGIVVAKFEGVTADALDQVIAQASGTAGP